LTPHNAGEFRNEKITNFSQLLVNRVSTVIYTNDTNKKYSYTFVYICILVLYFFNYNTFFSQKKAPLSCFLDFIS